jgi:hypothetical protein
MKMHLISVYLGNVGVTVSGFFLFPENEKPSITPEIAKSLGLSFLARGTTVSVG